MEIKLSGNVTDIDCEKIKEIFKESMKFNHEESSLSALLSELKMKELEQKTVKEKIKQKITSYTDIFPDNIELKVDLEDDYLGIWIDCYAAITFNYLYDFINKLGVNYSDINCVFATTGRLILKIKYPKEES